MSSVCTAVIFQKADTPQLLSCLAVLLCHCSAHYTARQMWACVAQVQPQQRVLAEPAFLRLWAGSSILAEWPALQQASHHACLQGLGAEAGLQHACPR